MVLSQSLKLKKSLLVINFNTNPVSNTDTNILIFQKTAQHTLLYIFYLLYNYYNIENIRAERTLENHLAYIHLFTDEETESKSCQLT